MKCHNPLASYHNDFEGEEIRLGDDVLVVDLDRNGNHLRRGEVIKLCSRSVRVRISYVHYTDPSHVYTHEVLRGGGWLQVVKHNPDREQELLNPTVTV